MATGSNTKRTIHAFYQFFQLKLCWEKDETKQQRGREWPIFKKNTLIYFSNLRGKLWPKQGSTLVEGGEGRIGPSGKLLCL